MSETYNFRTSLNGFNRSDVLNYIDTLLKEKEAISKEINARNDQIDSLENEINSLKKELEYLKNELENNNSATAKCDDCDISKKYEARLGAAMFDAKRFSEILVKEANDKASALFSEAYDSADKTASGVQKIAHDIVNINSQFNQSFKSLLDNMNALAKSLEAFKKETKVSGKKFNYSTEFSAEKNAIQLDLLYAEPTSDVNFDDADEFDIRVDV